MRRRETSNTLPTHVDIVDNPGGSVTLWPLFGWQGEVKWIEDVVTPSFNRQRRSGAVILNPYVVNWKSRTAPTAHGLIGPHGTWGTRDFSGDVCGWLGVPVDPCGDLSQLIASIQQGALIQAYAKMNSSDLNAAETMNDLSKTINMLRRPFKSMASLASKILRRKNQLLKSGRSLTKASSDAWLEYRYGWKPLIMDANTIIKRAETETFPSKKARLVARSSAGFSRTGKAPASGANVPSSLGTVTGTATQKRDVRASAGVIYEVANLMEHQGMSKFVGSRASDIPASLWAITPYSFVVDWFVGVEDWLKATTPVIGINVLGNWVTTVDKNTHSFEDVFQSVYIGPLPGADVGATYKNSITPSTINSVEVRRAVNQPIPSFPVRTVESLSVTQSISGVSLLLQKILSDVKGSRH